MKTVTKLPSSWRKARLEEVCDIILGQSPPGDTYSSDAKGLPFFQGKTEFGDYYPTPRKWCSAPTKIAEAEDVLISVRAPVGPTNLCPSRACIGRGLAAIRPRDGMLPRYVLYALRASVSALMEKATGTTFEAVNGSDLRAHMISVAPLPEQRRIVAEIEKQFSRLEEGVSALKRVQANLKRYRSAVLKAACEGKLVDTEAEIHRKHKAKNSKLGFETGEQLLKRVLNERRKNWSGRGKYKEPTAPDTTSLPQLPKGWTWSSIDQIAECLDGKRVPINKTERAQRQGNVPYYGANGQVGWIDTHIFEETLVLVVEDETFTGRTQPFCYMIRGKSWVNNHAHVLRGTNAVSNEYLNYSLSFYPFIPLTTGSTGRRKLTKKALMSAPFMLPPLAEQKRIVEEIERRLSVIEELESLVATNLQRGVRLRQAILQKAFEGELI
jgi:type I restriction enzyme S subunit